MKSRVLGVATAGGRMANGEAPACAAIVFTLVSALACSGRALPEGQVHVYVSRWGAEPGQRIEEDNVTTLRAPADHVPKTALLDRAAIVGRVATEKILVHEMYFPERLDGEPVQPRPAGLPDPPVLVDGKPITAVVATVALEAGVAVPSGSVTDVTVGSQYVSSCLYHAVDQVVGQVPVYPVLAGELVRRERLGVACDPYDDQSP
jgi:flagella basal body P-ring formation protein FlgA